jgi:hypothetical protein
MRIPLLNARRDAGRVDRHGDRRPRKVAGGHLDRTGPTRKRPPHFGDYKVSHRKVHARVAAIDFPSVGSHKASWWLRPFAGREVK